MGGSSQRLKLLAGVVGTAASMLLGGCADGIELNGKILAAQSSAFAANDERSSLIERVGDLEKEVARLKAALVALGWCGPPIDADESDGPRSAAGISS